MTARRVPKHSPKYWIIFDGTDSTIVNKSPEPWQISEGFTSWIAAKNTLRLWSEVKRDDYKRLTCKVRKLKKEDI